MHLTESKNSKILYTGNGTMGLSFGDTRSDRDAHSKGIESISRTLGAPNHVRNLFKREGPFYDWLKRDHTRSFLAKMMIPQMAPPQIGVENFRASPEGADNLQWVSLDNSMEGIYLSPPYMWSKEKNLGQLKGSLALENYAESKHLSYKVWRDTGVYSSWSAQSFLMVSRKEHQIGSLREFFDSVKETPENLVIWEDPRSDNLQLFDLPKMTDAELFRIYHDDLMRFERVRKRYCQDNNIALNTLKHTYEIKDNVVDMGR